MLLGAEVRDGVVVQKGGQYHSGQTERRDWIKSDVGSGYGTMRKSPMIAWLRNGEKLKEEDSMYHLVAMLDIISLLGPG